MQKVIFTGSLGFVFSNFIRKASYEKAPYLFCGVDKAIQSKQLNNIYYNKIISSNYLADITDNHIINNIFEVEKPDIVIHGATYIPSDESYLEVKECFNTNVIGTKLLLDACKKYNVSKFVYLSSDKLYASTPVNSSYSAKECDAVLPKSSEHISQFTAEQLIINSGVDYNILRICNLYGPRQDKNEFMIKILKSIKDKKEIYLNGDGSQVFDWMHVFDFSSAMLTILNNKLNNQIINVSSGQECSDLEVAQFICNALKSGHELIKFNKNNIKSNRHSMDNSKLINLGWKPNFKLKTGIEETCNWFELNQWTLK